MPSSDRLQLSRDGGHELRMPGGPARHQRALAHGVDDAGRLPPREVFSRMTESARGRSSRATVTRHLPSPPGSCSLTASTFARSRATKTRLASTSSSPGRRPGPRARREGRRSGEHQLCAERDRVGRDKTHGVRAVFRIAERPASQVLGALAPGTGLARLPPKEFRHGAPHAAARAAGRDDGSGADQRGPRRVALRLSLPLARAAPSRDEHVDLGRALRRIRDPLHECPGRATSTRRSRSWLFVSAWRCRPSMSRRCGTTSSARSRSFSSRSRRPTRRVCRAASAPGASAVTARLRRSCWRGSRPPP